VVGLGVGDTTLAQGLYRTSGMQYGWGMQGTSSRRCGGGDLSGKVAWVTGAGRGLGRVIAIGMAAAGARLALTARTEVDLKAVAAELDTEVLLLAGSVADADFATKAADRIQAEMGSLDVLVNMAGINPEVTRSELLSDDSWDEVIGVNLSGTFYCCRGAARHMLAAGSGSIINVSSVHGHTGVSRMAAYAASKGGVENLTRALAIEWAQGGVRVNCLAPGYFRTALTEPYLSSRHGERVRAQIPQARFGEAAELVGAAIFLASDAASYMAGAIVSIDGGWSAG